MSTEKKSESASEGKIFVDEGWKSQVEKEKEAWRKTDSHNFPEQPDATARNGDQMPLPPVSFGLLMSTLATQAMACLGIFPDPTTGTTTVNRPMAKHFIDMLAMLEEKTAGNLSVAEADQLRDGLHQLRMIFIAIPSSTVVPPEKPAVSSIVLP